MKLDIDTLRDLIAVFKEAGLSRLLIKTDDYTLELERGIPQEPPVSVPVKPQGELTSDVPSGEAHQEDNYHYIRSPIVGTFYRAPAPGADPFVREGDRVKKGDVVCIVEAMKIMNEIKSDVDGVVEEILVENAQPVEYNQPLFKIRLT